MTTAFTLPPDDLLAAFDSLEATLKTDTSGDRARRLNRYFAQVELEARQSQVRSIDFDEKRMAGLLAEAFAATQRGVCAAWNKLHGRELAA
ncbi:MAG TPA: hypothetical protein VF453_04200 [Burkholderiaceae bacterium]